MAIDADEPGREWERVSGLTLPTVHSMQPDQAVPDTVIKVYIEVTGGGLPEGDSATIILEPLKLNTINAFELDVLAEEQTLADMLADDWAVKPDSRPRRVELHIRKALLVDEGGSGLAFTVKTPDSEHHG